MAPTRACLREKRAGSSHATSLAFAALPQSRRPSGAVTPSVVSGDSCWARSPQLRGPGLSQGVRVFPQRGDRLWTAVAGGRAQPAPADGGVASGDLGRRTGWRRVTQARQGGGSCGREMTRPTCGAFAGTQLCVAGTGRHPPGGRRPAAGGAGAGGRGRTGSGAGPPEPPPLKCRRLSFLLALLLLQTLLLFPPQFSCCHHLGHRAAADSTFS